MGERLDRVNVGEGCEAYSCVVAAPGHHDIFQFEAMLFVEPDVLFLRIENTFVTAGALGKLKQSL